MMIRNKVLRVPAFPVRPTPVVFTNVGLLEQNISLIGLILEYRQNGAGVPEAVTPRQNAVPVKFRGNAVDSVTSEVLGKNALNHLRLLRNDTELVSFSPVAVSRNPDPESAVPELPVHRPFVVDGNGPWT